MSEPDDTSVRNSMSGSVTGNSVQIGTMHGNVVWRSRGVVILLVATLLAALGAGIGAAWLTSSSATTQEPPVGSDPVSVTVEQLTDMCLVPWVVPTAPTEINFSTPMTTNYSWRAWEPTKNGISAAPTNVRLTVQGRTEAQVVLTGIRVLVHERRPPLVGTAVKGACGDEGALRWLRVDLDVEPPRILPVASVDATQLPGDPQWELRPIKFPYEVSLSDVETFLIEAHTLDCVCAWTAELSWASQGRTGTVVIDDHGEWFRTSTTKGMTWCSVYTTPGQQQPSCDRP